MQIPKASILVVEDEQEIARLLEKILQEEGYHVHSVNNAFKARGAIERLTPDLVILDRRLPDADGLELCREIRSQPKTQNLPVLFLTAKKTPTERVLGMKIGGDDYLTKPFSPEEVVAHVEAILRRTRGDKTDSSASGFQLGELRVDGSARKAYLKKKDLELSSKELDLLQAFLERPGHVLSREFLLQRVWGYREDLELTTKVVDVTVGHLRGKLGPYGRHISAVRKYGYRLDAEKT